MNTKSRINIKSFLYRTFAVFMIALLALVALPVTPAYAAVSRPNDWISVGNGRGTGVALTVAGTYAAVAGTQRYALLAVYVVDSGANITPTVSGNWGGVAFNSNTPTRFIGQYGSGSRRTVFMFGFDNADIVARTGDSITFSSSATANTVYMHGYMSTFEGVNQASPYTFGSGGNTAGNSTTAQYSAALNTVNGSYGAAVLLVGANTGGGVTNADLVTAAPNTVYAMNVNNVLIGPNAGGGSGAYATLATKAFTGTATTRPTFTFSNARNNLIGVVLAPASALTAQTITITTPAPATATYQSTFTVAATASSLLVVTYSSGTPTVCTNAGALFTIISGTGTCIVQYNQAGNGTFSAASQVTNSVAAQPATLTYTANTASRAFGAANPAFTGTVTGFLNGENQATATTGVLAFTSTATVASPAGSYPITGSGLTANNGNYNFVQAVGNATALTITPAVVGTTYYVNKTNANCSDTLNTGLTIPLPFCTIGRGVTAAVAGDTVRVLAGTYAETVTMVRSGSAGNPITFSAAPGVTVTGAASYGFRASGRSYIIIDGFNVTGTSNIGISVATSDHIIISNNHVNLSGSPVNGSIRAGINLNATTFSTVSGNTTDHNSDTGIYLSGGSANNTISNNISFANANVYQRNANGIHINGAATINNTIIHNITYANEDTGIQLYAGANNNFIIGNLSYGNADHGIDELNSPNNTIVGNTVQGNFTSGINVEGTSTNTTIANNVAVDNGIVSTRKTSNICVDANSVAGSTMNYDLVFLTGALGGVDQIGWNGTNYPTLAAFRTAVPAQEAQGREANPLFVTPAAPAVEPNNGNGGLPPVNVGDYHIASGSPAIDSANSNAPSEPLLDIEGNARVDAPVANTGAGVRAYDDRGAYEFQTGGSLPAVTTEAVTAIGTTTATGNGTISSLGAPNPYQYGVVWDTAANPTIALSTKTTQGAASATGAFTSAITGLTPGTLYHIRAYATNAAGTSYGADVSFAVTAISVTTSGSPSVYGTPVTFTATVLPVTATGTVTFFDGVTVLGTGTLSAGTATLSTSTLSVSGSPHSITATLAGSGIYGSNTSSPILQTITPATLTYTANPASRIYGAVNPAFSGTITGFIAPDTQLNATTGALSFTSTATATSNVGSYAITGSGLTANNGNYTFVQAAGNATALTITPATLTYTADAISRAYGVANPAFTGTVTGFVAPDTQLNATTGTLSFTSTATTTSNVGSYAITGSGLTANNGNYTFVQAAGNATALTVTPATLTYTANPASRIHGAANPAFSATVTGFVAPDTQLNATTGVLSFTSTATATSNVGSYAITGSGLTANNGNYTFVQAAGNATALTITPATLTYTADAISRAYGVANPAFTGTVTGFVAPDTQLNATTGTLSFTSTATTTSNVGSYAITGSGLTANNGNYTFVQAAGNATALTVTPVALTITASSGTMTYGGTVPTITPIYTGLQAGDIAPATPPTCSTTATSTSSVGTYPSSCAGAVDSNYNISYTAGSVGVTPVLLTITASSGTMTYGGTVPTITPSYSGLQAGDLAPATPPTCSTTATNTSPVGSYPSTCTGAVDANYTIGYTAGSVTITPAATLTITASSGTMTYGGTVPTITPSYSGLQAGDVAPAIPPTCSTTATSTSPVGSYPSTCTGAVDANYNISYTAGSISITPATLTITASSDTMTYGGTVPTITPSYGGLQAGDIAPATPPTCSTTATNTSPVGSYLSNCAGAADTNYNIGYTAGSVSVTPAAAIVILSNLAQTYDRAPKSVTVTTTPLNLSTNVTYDGLATVPTNAGSYAVVATITDANYSGSASDTLIIGPATVTPGITASNKIYDGNTTASFTCALTGVIGLDSVNCTGGTANFADLNVGTWTVTATGLGLSGADSANYQLSSTSAADTADITQRTLNVTAAGVNKIYDGTTAATVTLADDRVIGDAITTVYTTASFVDPNIGTGITVNVSGISITGGANSGNYALGNTTATTTANITNASQTITVVTSAPSSASNSTKFDVKATASSGLPVTITTSGSCSGGGTNGTATITMTSGSGTCSVFYDQDGVPNYSAAPQIQQDVTATEGPVFTSADKTSFDVGFLGNFNITAAGNPSTMTISVSGALPAGVSFTNNGDGTADFVGTPVLGAHGTYNLILTANNGVAPNATQNFTLTVRNGPVVAPAGINSTPDTGNGSISENESIIDTLGIAKITVEFSRDVYNPANDTDVKDVTNPANYLLVRSSSSVFQTASCEAGPVAPDVTIAVDSVTYSNGGGSGPFISTLSINGGFPLNVVGFYRLYVCGTTSIVDATNTNLILAGDGTTPGTDFQRNFRIMSQISDNGDNSSGKNKGNTATTLSASGLLIPVTGFAPDQVTIFPVQPSNKAYKPLNEIRIEIPTLGINFPIVGVALNKNSWDLTWLQNSVGYLEGSAYPTWSGNTVLSAHVIDAYKNLGPFSDIKGMQLGQKVYIHFNKQVYVYQVQENRKILPSNISAVFKHEEDSWITLVTCEDFNAKTGLYTNRRMVRAVLISVITEK